jgi:hypothetical protein
MMSRNTKAVGSKKEGRKKLISSCASNPEKGL